MAKSASVFVCTTCAAQYPKWIGRCSKCQEYGTVEEVVNASGASRSAGLKGNLSAAPVSRPARRVADINTAAHRHTPTGINELDRVLGGGLVAGQAILIAGEPGVGKSTLLLGVADKYAATGKTVLYVSGEESAEQITLRARRIGALADTLLIADETDLSVLLGHIEAASPDLVIVDSVQTLASLDVEGRAGGVAQVQEVSAVLTRIAKARHIPVVLVGQVTKEGSIAGPRLLEHLVDTVLYFEGDRQTSLRLLRTVKNRFGAADEVACFEQGESGLVEVPDPSSLFRTGRENPVPGTCVTVAMEGRRAMLAEVQALVSPTNAPNPRRGVSGLDSARSAMLVAVTERHGRLRLFDKDTYLATVAGLRLVEPASDLATCLALASAAWEVALPNDVAAIGEVALSGDIRPAPSMAQRISEASRLGYKRLLVPTGTRGRIKGSLKEKDITLLEIPNLRAALTALQQIGIKSKED